MVLTPVQQDAPPEVPNDLPPVSKQEEKGEGNGEGKEEKKMDELVNVNLLSDRQKVKAIADT